MAKVIIFGNKELAEIANFYLQNDSEHEVIGFCVHKKYIDNDTFKSLPVFPLENIEHTHPADNFMFLAPMTSRRMNTLRENIYNEIKEKGYDFISYVSSRAIMNGCKTGDNCFILEGTVFQPYCKIGNNIMISVNCYIGHHTEIADHATISGQVAIEGRCVIGKNSFIGVNSTIRNRMILAKGTLVGMSTSIIKDTNKWSVYMGVPAKEIGKGISKIMNNG